MDYRAIDKVLANEGIYTHFETLIREGKNPGFLLTQIGDMVSQGIFPERKAFVTLFILCVLFGAISQIILAFGENGFSQYGGTIFFLCGAGICMRLFLQCFTLVGQCMEAMCRFMSVLTPVYGMSLLFAGGMGTASAVYAALMGELAIFQMVLKGICFPAAKLLLAFHFANASTNQHLLKRMGDLLFDGVTLLMKTMLSLICAWNVVEGLIAPGADAVVKNGVQKAAMLLPGIGPVSSTCLGVMTGVAHTLKNSIGAVGLLCMGVLFLTPMITVVFYLAAFRLLEACIHPFATESMITILTGTYQSILLLFKILVYAITFVFVSFSILTVLT